MFQVSLSVSTGQLSLDGLTKQVLLCVGKDHCHGLAPASNK